MNRKLATIGLVFLTLTAIACGEKEFGDGDNTNPEVPGIQETDRKQVLCNDGTWQSYKNTKLSVACSTHEGADTTGPGPFGDYQTR